MTNSHDFRGKSARFFGISIIATAIASCLLISIFVAFEFFLSTNTTTTSNKQLYETGYYGSPLNFEPYKKFTIQHLHPYFIFSLPWMQNDIEEANNDFVKIEKNGFRKSLTLGRKNKGVLLGGSTAFGYFSSSDSKTLSSQLTAKSEYDFINRNAPSWNTHQELIALVKYSEPYDISVSFSVANDMAIFCATRAWESPVIDQMESFDRLKRYFNDIRGEPLIEDATQEPNMLRKSISFLLTPFPRSVSFLKKILKSPSFVPEQDRFRFDECSKHEDLLVTSILNNELAMRQISNARGASHWLVIQPMLSLHTNAGFGSNAESIFKRSVINKIIGSNYCKENCVDMSSIFSSMNPENFVYDPSKSEKWREACFADAVHLTDQCVSIVAEFLSKKIRSGLGNSNRPISVSLAQPKP